MKALAALGMAIAAMAGAEPGEKNVLTEADFAQLRFLEGRWQGKAPDGTIFYEEYDFPDRVTMRSRRFTDSSFASSTDGSTVALENGQIVSRWGEFSWTAQAVEPGRISFAPMNAPGAFAWRRVDADTVEVTQRWKDEKGADQSYSLRLERVVAAK